MTKGSRKLFTSDSTLLFALCSFRRNGWSIRSLSFIFQCDSKAVRNQFEKFEITPLSEEIYYFPDIIAPIIQLFPPQASKWRISNGERVNVGHTYKEYLELSHQYSPRS